MCEIYNFIVPPPIARKVSVRDAARIMSTFVEGYDLSGKTVVPFCTSGSSGIGSGAFSPEQLSGSGTWLEGHRFSGSDSRETILNWADCPGIAGKGNRTEAVLPRAGR